MWGISFFCLCEAYTRPAQDVSGQSHFFPFLPHAPAKDFLRAVAALRIGINHANRR